MSNGNQHDNPCIPNPYAVAHQAHIDTRAIEIATRALTKLEEHEGHCIRAADHQRREITETRTMINQQHNDLMATLRTVHARIDDLYGRWWKIAGTLILVLLAIIGVLATDGAPWVDDD